MECSITFIIWPGLCICIAVASFFFATTEKKATSISKKLPPGPPGWPVLGNLFDLSAKPHQSLAVLSRTYGPVMWIRFGTINTMVVSSAQAAMEFFKNHDLTFAGRTTNEANRVHRFNQGSMVFAQHGPYWRMLRRICTAELFSNSRINDTECLRRNCIDTMLSWLSDAAQEKRSVEIAQIVSFMMFNVTSNLLLSKDLVDPQSHHGADFFASLHRGFEWTAKGNLADLFPSLRWLDPQRVKKHTKRDMGRVLDFASSFVQERIEERKNGRVNRRRDFLDVMLDFEGSVKDGEPAKFSLENISILILELFATSTDTTTRTVEWAMTELLRDPTIMRKVQAELDEVVGRNKKVEEGDIGKLPYLQAVVKETLRLHPPAPVLIPRRAGEDTEFMGYSIPKDTQAFINVWAIGRDPVSWEDPLLFKPERFIGSEVEYKGNNFEFLPFGAGRRICVGMSLGHRLVHLALGSLIQSFEWVLENGVPPETLDMTEKFGITLCKAEALKAVPELRMSLTVT